MKNKVFSRLTSLLLVFIMIFTMLPLQVFAVGEGGGSDAKINSSNKYVKDNGYDANATGVGGIFNAFALRFSLYFFEGAESYEDLETKNYTQVLELGKPINIKYYESRAGSLSGKYTNYSVYDYMSPNVNLSFDKYKLKMKTGSLPMVSVTNEYGENLTDIFPKMFTFINMNDPHKSTKTFNEFLQGVDDITKFIDSGTKKFNSKPHFL